MGIPVETPDNNQPDRTKNPKQTKTLENQQAQLLVVGTPEGSATGSSNPQTYFGANPMSWVAQGASSLSFIAEASASIVTASALPVRLAALGTLSGHVAKLTFDVGEASASALFYLGSSSGRPGRGTYYEDAV